MTTTTRPTLVAAALALIGGTANGATLRVPQIYPGIQSAVDAAQPNDTVLVSPGTYFERVVIVKNVKLLSSHGARRTTIDATHHGSAVKIDGTGSPALSVTVSGFTLIHGEIIFPPTVQEPDITGTGIYIKSASANINHNIIEENLGCQGGIFGFGPRISVTDNVVRNNSGSWVCGFRGGGITLGNEFDQELVLARNDVYGNASYGVNVFFVGKLSVTNNHVHHNGGTQETIGAGLNIDTASGVVTNNLVDHNVSPRGSAFMLTTQQPEEFPVASLLISGNTVLHNDPVLLNDGEPIDGSVIAIADYRGSTIKFVGNRVIGSSPSALIFCEQTDTPPVVSGNLLINFAGPTIGESCRE